MEKIKNNKKSLFAYIFIAVLFVAAFAAFIKKDSVKDSVIIITAMAGAFLALSDKIQDTVRIILISLVSAAGIAYSIDYLFYFLPIIILLLILGFFRDGAGKKVTAVFSVILIHIISEIVILFVIIKPDYVNYWYDETYRRFFFLFIAFELIFAALSVSFIIKSNFIKRFKQVKNIKKQKWISKNKQKLVSELNTFKAETALFFCNVLYTLNMVLYMASASNLFGTNPEYTLFALLCSFYLVCLIQKIFLPRLAETNPKLDTLLHSPSSVIGFLNFVTSYILEGTTLGNATIQKTDVLSKE